MKEVFDKNRKQINVMNEVLVPEPNESDIHNFEFVGTVSDILDNGNVIVEDGDSDFFEIEAERLEVIHD